MSVSLLATLAAVYSIYISRHHSSCGQSLVPLYTYMMAIHDAKILELSGKMIWNMKWRYLQIRSELEGGHGVTWIVGGGKIRPSST
jgi:hypothetical protein